jgi:transcriptional regulator with XRE-family HTH domain
MVRCTGFREPFSIIAADARRIKWIFGLITIEQIRAARGLLGWTQSELASRAGVSVPTVKRFEANIGAPVSELSRSKMRQALELAGIKFIAENGGGPGVRLRKRMARTMNPQVRKSEHSYDYQMRNGDTILQPVQCRMARVALGFGVRELAAAASVSPDTVARFERGDELKQRTVQALRQVFELAGVEFTNGDRPGVRLVGSAEAPASPKPAATRRAKSSRRKE